MSPVVPRTLPSRSSSEVRAPRAAAASASGARGVSVSPSESSLLSGSVDSYGDAGKAEPSPMLSSRRGSEGMGDGTGGASAPASFVSPSEAREIGSVDSASAPGPSGLGTDPEALGPGVFPPPSGDQESLLGMGDDPVVGDVADPEEVEMERQFEAVLGLIRESNRLGEAATIPSRRRFSSLELSLVRASAGRPSVELPWSPLAENILGETNSQVCGLEGSLSSSRSSRLLPPPLQRQRRFYRPESSAASPLQLPSSVAQLTEGCSVESLKKEGLSFSSAEGLNMESVAMSAIHASSWLDLWSNTLKDFGPGGSSAGDRPKFERLLVSGGRALSFLTSQITNLWANLVLRRRDTVRRSFSKQVSAESSLGLRNSSLLASPSLFSESDIQTALERKRSASQDALIQRAVSFKAPSGASKGAAAKPPSGGAATSGFAPKASTSGGKGNAGPSSASQGKGRASAQPFPNSRPSSSGKKSGEGKKEGGGGRCRWPAPAATGRGFAWHVFGDVLGPRGREFNGRGSLQGVSSPI